MSDKIDLSKADEKTNIGEIKELTEAEKAQITMTYWVLFAVAALFTLSGTAYIWTDNGVANYLADIQKVCAVDVPSHEHAVEFCRKYLSEAQSKTNSAAKEVFEFCKNFLPPIVTLVLGAHYVTKANDQN